MDLGRGYQNKGDKERKHEDNLQSAKVDLRPESKIKLNKGLPDACLFHRIAAPFETGSHGSIVRRPLLAES